MSPSFLNKKLSPQFFSRDTLSVAKDLIGCSIATRIDGQITSGMIVEVEAYCGETDLACHAAVGRTKRNDVLFWNGGFCYVYLIYGLHYCVNVVTEKKGRGTAVLVRAIEPLAGLSVMKKRRNTDRIANISNGPGKVCEALGINISNNGEHFSHSKIISLRRYKRYSDDRLVWTPRIGITKAVEMPWRVYLKDNPFVSPTPKRSREL